MQLFLIRHGMTALGEEGRYQGRLDAGLTKTGRDALCAAGSMPEHVYVSPAARARETAEILFPGSRQIIVSDLREMDFGAFEGRGWWEMEQDADYRAWVDGGCMGRCPGGEDRTGFSARVCAAVRDILEAETKTGENGVYIVAHGGTQMAVLEHWGRPPREYYRWQRGCGCGWRLIWDERQETLTVEEEISYLR